MVPLRDRRFANYKRTQLEEESDAKKGMGTKNTHTKGKETRKNGKDKNEKWGPIIPWQKITETCIICNAFWFLLNIIKSKITEIIKKIYLQTKNVVEYRRLSP